MSQSSATKLVSKLRFKLHERRKLSCPEGPIGRHDKIKKTITALFKYERIELNYHRADESRGYAERLISDAIRHGDCHKPTMDMASYWIIERPIIHKLFKVLAPRYQNSRVSYTKLWFGPNIYPGMGYQKVILELRNNIYPPLEPDKSYVKNQIHNVLLEAARQEYEKKKKESKMKSEENQTDVKSNVETLVDGNTDSVKMGMTDKESELPNADNIKTDSLNVGETEEKSKVNLMEEGLDLSKMKITEEKHSASPDEGEKKD